MKQKLLMSWSSGKDAAWCLHTLRQSNNIEVVGLLTTLNQDAERVAMHAVRESLLDLQAKSVGLDYLHKVHLPYPCSNDVYEQIMAKAMDEVVARGVTHMGFGDLFLEDIRQYREEKLAKTSVAPVFPLFGSNTAELSREMIDNGLKAYITCVDPKQLSPSFIGRLFDHSLLDELPASVDPCGENGEFHTFVFDGPMFSAPLAVKKGPTVLRDGFVFQDILL